MSQDYGEQRFVILGMADGRVQRDERIRIISARKATKREQRQYFEEIAAADVQ
jgi:uncharacterized protein